MTVQSARFEEGRGGEVRRPTSSAWHHRAPGRTGSRGGSLVVRGMACFDIRLASARHRDTMLPVDRTTMVMHHTVGSEFTVQASRIQAPLCTTMMQCTGRTGRDTPPRLMLRTANQQMIRRRGIDSTGIERMVKRTLSHARQDDGAVDQGSQHQACDNERACCSPPRLDWQVSCGCSNFGRAASIHLPAGQTDMMPACNHPQRIT